MTRIKLSTLLGSAAILLSAFTTPLLAGSLGIGVSGIGMLVEAEGKETLKNTSVVTNKKGLSSGAAVGSVYAQYTFGTDGFVIGVEAIPGSAVIGDVTSSRLDNTTDGVGLVGTTIQNTAKAVIKDHRGIYIETPGFGSPGLFLKGGWSEVKLLTQESLDTGSSYKDATIDAFTVGIGFKSDASTGLQMKLIAEYTDYDHISLTSTGDADDSNVTNKIDADLETTGIRFSIGYNF